MTQLNHESYTHILQIKATDFCSVYCCFNWFTQWSCVANWLLVHMFSSGGNTYLLSVITQSVLCSCWVNQIIRMLLTNTGKKTTSNFSSLSIPRPAQSSVNRKLGGHLETNLSWMDMPTDTFHIGCRMCWYVYIYIFGPRMAQEAIFEILICKMFMEEHDIQWL